MIIKKIELQGFKSFPERTKIIFHPGITAIIGPNGTGKSNIVDAILWVFGGQRTKSQRGERSGDAIFNGNTKKAPMGMADVVLSLKDDDEDLIINHRVFRSGESEYRLNGKLVRLRDIHDSLWKRNIAEKEYFVIEQGQIGLFLTSKPTEKRGLIEEAAGTAFYKDKKKQAQNKLENSEQNLIRLEDIITEISRAKNSLKRQASTALKYRKLREDIRRLTSLHYRKKILLHEKNLRDISLRLEGCLNREKEFTSRLKEKEKELGYKRKEVWDLEKSIKEGQQNLFSLNSQFSRLETDREKGEERISLLGEKKEKAQENTEEITQELLQLKTERAGAEEDLKKLSEILGLKQQDITKTDKACQISQEKLAAWGARRKALRDEYFRKLSKHTEIKNEKSRLKKETELILRQEEKLHGQLSKEKALLQQKEKKQEQQKRAAAQTQNLIKEREIEIGSLQKAQNEILSSAESLQNKISELKDKKEEEVHHLQALEKLEKKERSTGAPVDIPGALGLLADLIEADAEHVPLIDIFWEEETKALLIDPQDMMKTLADRELKGNFLLLSPKGKEDVPSALSQDPRVMGLFKAYIRPSNKIKDYLSHLQEAAVVRDVKSAIQLWTDFPSLNYITPRGDVLLSSGLLKLGAKKEGIFTLGQEIKKVKENIAQIDREIEPVELKLKDKMEQKHSNEDKIQRESTLLSQLEREIEEIEKENTYDQTEREKIKINIDLLTKELAVFGQDRKALTKKTEALSLTIKTLENEEDTLKQNVEEEEREYQDHQEINEKKRDHFFEIKAEIDLLQEKIKNLYQQREALNRREETLKTKKIALQEEIRECEEEKTRVNVNIKNLSKKAQSLQEKRKKHESNLTQSEILLQQMKENQADMEKGIEQLREDCEARKEERVKSDISKAEADRDLVNLEESCWQDLKKTLEEVKESAPEEKYPDAEIEERLSEAEENLQKLKSVNLMAEEEYLIQKKRHDFLILEKKDLRESIDTTREAINKIDHESKDQFMKALTEVNKNLQEVFSILFNGGTAEVKLIDPSHPLESGVEIVAQPPGKKVQNLSLLSGGEKSLTSLAFSFALFRYKPTPFCILDEVDAALDEVNLARFLELMKKTKNQTQFIIITHNTKTVEVSDYIYGTTMEEPNVTSLYSIKLEKKEKNLP